MLIKPLGHCWPSHLSIDQHGLALIRRQGVLFDFVYSAG